MQYAEGRMECIVADGRENAQCLDEEQLAEEIDHDLPAQLGTDAPWCGAPQSSAELEVGRFESGVPNQLLARRSSPMVSKRVKGNQVQIKVMMGPQRNNWLANGSK